MNKLSALLWVLCQVGAAACASAADPAQPLIVAHRGLLAHAPENTLANFRACLVLRLGFEFDVQRSKDGHLVCIHDATVDRTTSGRGQVADLTLAEIRRLDAGSWFDAQFAGERVPTVEEVLQLIAEYSHQQVLIAVDLKAENVEQDVVHLAKNHEVLGRLLFIGRTISEPGVRQGIRKAAPEAHVAALANAPGEFSQALSEADADWVYVRYLPSHEEIALVTRHRKRVFIAGPTVSGNLPENWRKAADAGVDAILTDFPLELRAALRLKPTRQ